MESTLKKGDKVIGIGCSIKNKILTCANDSELGFAGIDTAIIGKDKTEVVELEGQPFKYDVSFLKKIDPTVLTDEELAKMVSDIFQPAVDAVTKLANAMMNNVSDLTVPDDLCTEGVNCRCNIHQKSKPSLRAFLQKLADKHNVSFINRIDSSLMFYLDSRNKQINAEYFFSFDRCDFEDDFYYGDRITPTDICESVNCKCNITPQVYSFNGKKLSTLTNAEKLECKKCIKEHRHSGGFGTHFSTSEYAELLKLLEPTENHDA